MSRRANNASPAAAAPRVHSSPTPQVQPSQHGAVVPVVHHIPPVVVCVGLGQAAVQIPQGAGGALEPGRVVEDEDGAQGTLNVGGQFGGAGHVKVGVRVIAAEVHGVDVQLDHHLAVAVPIFAVGGKGVLQGGLGGLRQVVGGHHGHIVVGVGGKEILPDEAVAHKGRGNAEDDHPFQVVVPPVGPALLAGVGALFARGEVFGVDVAFVTVACHGTVSSRMFISAWPEWSGARLPAAASAQPCSCRRCGWAAGCRCAPGPGGSGCRCSQTGRGHRLWPPEPPGHRS